mmetsp:Transcript_117678/g.313056  ORF Transcript_117678/g.313056 Transcript_117678/m.313056 type:complete len:266 (-) Transcript_117678:124-921(-)
MFAPRLLLLTGTLASYWVGEASALLQQTVQPHAGGVKLELFYESMCPYCHKFFNETLKTLWEDKEMRSLVDLQLHPAGNLQAIDASTVSKGYFYWHPSKKTDKYIYICQHGESECLGNLIHMCAQKVLTPEKYMPFLFCMAAQPESVPEKSSYACMQELSIEPVPIRDCVFSPTANEEMFEIVQADANLKQKREYVPWVVINGKHLEIKDGKAELREAICSALGEKAPASCLLTPAAVPTFVRLEGGERRMQGRCQQNSSRLLLA